MSDAIRLAKRSIFLSVALIASSSVVAHAQSSKEDLEECKRMEDSAKSVMKARQAGAPMSKLWDVAVNTHDEYLEGMYKMLITNAYDKPRFSTEEMQERSVTDFQNDFFAACMRNAEKRRNKT